MEKTSKTIGETAIPEDVFLDIKRDVRSVFSFKPKFEALQEKDTTAILEVILSFGISFSVSDIHIEPEKDSVKLRVRLDGILQDAATLDHKLYESVLSRIKLLSGIKLNITQKSQDGSFSVSFPETSIDKRGRIVAKSGESGFVEIRTSTLPSEYGETAVLRILNPKSLVEIEDLGLRNDLKEVFEKEIRKPNGMIIVAGPTGSGKTTTLYAILKKIRKPEIKIITIEDPIEYHLEGTSQTEVHQGKGYDFANGLRAVVRQDPDVILVGEIRDLETAQIALQASLTGHLVLSTLHTNDSSGAIARLQALGEKLHNIASGINMVVAQRLVRKVCSCVKKERMTDEEYQSIRSLLKNVPSEIVDFSRETKIPRKTGCIDCSFTGYRSRIGIFEAFLIDDEIESFILTAPSMTELKKKAVEKGMITMRQDGVIKVLQGKTTLEEIERVALE